MSYLVCLDLGFNHGHVYRLHYDLVVVRVVFARWQPHEYVPQHSPIYILYQIKYVKTHTHTQSMNSTSFFSDTILRWASFNISKKCLLQNVWKINITVKQINKLLFINKQCSLYKQVPHLRSSPTWYSYTIRYKMLSRFLNPSSGALFGVFFFTSHSDLRFVFGVGMRSSSVSLSVFWKHTRFSSLVCAITTDPHYRFVLVHSRPGQRKRA